jgi:hypothetical protein
VEHCQRRVRACHVLDAHFYVVGGRACGRLHDGPRGRRRG